MATYGGGGYRVHQFFGGQASVGNSIQTAVPGTSPGSNQFAICQATLSWSWPAGTTITLYVSGLPAWQEVTNGNPTVRNVTGVYVPPGSSMAFQASVGSGSLTATVTGCLFQNNGV